MDRVSGLHPLNEMRLPRVVLRRVLEVESETVRPAVFPDQFNMLLRTVALSAVRGIALDHRTVKSLDYVLPELRAQEVLISLLARVQFYRYPSRQFLARRLVQLRYLFGRYLS